MILQPTIIGEKLPTLTNPGSAADLLAGKQLIDADGNVLTGTMPTQGAQTITPGTAAKTIAAGRYLTGVQTIQGDADLIAANIKSGVNIFGVTGILEEAPEFMNVASAIGEGKDRLYVPNISKLPNIAVAIIFLTETVNSSEVVIFVIAKASSYTASFCVSETDGNTYTRVNGGGNFSILNNQLALSTSSSNQVFGSGKTYTIYYI